LNLFEGVSTTGGIFVEKDALRSGYTPDRLPHREKEIDNLVTILAPLLKGDPCSNIFIYGKTGTGKTATVKQVGSDLADIGRKKGREIDCVYVNCEVVDTQYRVLANLANHFIKTWADRVPFTGWPLDEVYERMRQAFNSLEGSIIIILDEVDKLVSKSGDDVLYTLSALTDDLSRSDSSLIGVSNDLRFAEFLDPRVRSRLSEEEMVFPPYEAAQLRDILMERARLAFADGALTDEALSLCSALAAQEHGDARRALTLLRVAGEVAEREGSEKIEERHVRRAGAKIEVDRITEAIRTLPIQSKLVMLSVIDGRDLLGPSMTTGEVYEVYDLLSKELDMPPLTQRRFTDLISELDMLGLLNARVVSKGRYGRTREIELRVNPESSKAQLESDDLLSQLRGFRPRLPQTRLI
jgi:cell division control protein 6